MYEAETIMTKAVVCAWPEMPIYEAIRLMAERRITSLPVVNEQLNLLGCLYEEDMLKAVYACEEDVLLTVAEFMRTDVETFSPNDDFIIVCDRMATSHQRNFCVVKGKTLLGVVGRADLIKAMLELKHQELVR